MGVGHGTASDKFVPRVLPNVNSLIILSGWGLVCSLSVLNYSGRFVHPGVAYYLVHRDTLVRIVPFLEELHNSGLELLLGLSRLA